MAPAPHPRGSSAAKNPQPPSKLAPSRTQDCGRASATDARGWGFEISSGPGRGAHRGRSEGGRARVRDAMPFARARSAATQRVGSPASEDLPPIALTEQQMAALLAAPYPLPARTHSAFLEHCAREIANLPELGDGVLHRTIAGRAAALLRSAGHRRPHAPRQQVGAMSRRAGAGHLHGSASLRPPRIAEVHVFAASRLQHPPSLTGAYK